MTPRCRIVLEALLVHLVDYGVEAFSSASNNVLRGIAEAALIAQPQVAADEDNFLIVRPGLPLDVGAQLVVPPLPALLADSAWERLCDHAPLTLALRFYQPAAQTCTCYQ